MADRCGGGGNGADLRRKAWLEADDSLREDGFTIGIGMGISAWLIAAAAVAMVLILAENVAGSGPDSLLLGNCFYCWYRVVLSVYRFCTIACSGI